MNGIPFPGPNTLTTLVRLSAVMQSRAMTVTRLWSVNPMPVRGSTMWE